MFEHEYLWRILIDIFRGMRVEGKREEEEGQMRNSNCCIRKWRVAKWNENITLIGTC